MTIYTLGKEPTQREARIDMSARTHYGDQIALDLNGDINTTRLVFSREETILVIDRLSTSLI